MRHSVILQLPEPLASHVITTYDSQTLILPQSSDPTLKVQVQLYFDIENLPKQLPSRSRLRKEVHHCLKSLKKYKFHKDYTRLVLTSQGVKVLCVFAEDFENSPNDQEMHRSKIIHQFLISIGIPALYKPTERAMLDQIYSSVLKRSLKFSFRKLFWLTKWFIIVNLITFLFYIDYDELAKYDTDDSIDFLLDSGLSYKDSLLKLGKNQLTVGKARSIARWLPLQFDFLDPIDSYVIEPDHHTRIPFKVKSRKSIYIKTNVTNSLTGEHLFAGFYPMVMRRDKEYLIADRIKSSTMMSPISIILVLDITRSMSNKSKEIISSLSEIMSSILFEFEEGFIQFSLIVFGDRSQKHWKLPYSLEVNKTISSEDILSKANFWLNQPTSFGSNQRESAIEAAYSISDHYSEFFQGQSLQWIWLITDAPPYTNEDMDENPKGVTLRSLMEQTNQKSKTQVHVIIPKRKRGEYSAVDAAWKMSYDEVSSHLKSQVNITPYILKSNGSLVEIMEYFRALSIHKISSDQNLVSPVSLTRSLNNTLYSIDNLNISSSCQSIMLKYSELELFYHNLNMLLGSKNQATTHELITMLMSGSFCNVANCGEQRKKNKLSLDNLNDIDWENSLQWIKTQTKEKRKKPDDLIYIPLCAQ